MTKNERALKLVKIWAQNIGAHEAKKRLIVRDLSPTAADKMVRGNYPSTPNPLTTGVLLDEMAKDGFVLDPEAS